MRQTTALAGQRPAPAITSRQEDPALRRLRQIAPVGVVMILSLAVFALTFDSRRVGSDDAFITYRYADNLARGYGFVFNPGAAPVLGTSTPLYTLLLAAVARLGADIPTASMLLGAIGTSVALGLVVMLAADLGTAAAGIAAAVLWTMIPLASAVMEGMETPIYLALVLGALWTAHHGLRTTSLLVAALAVLTRIDGLAILAVVAIRFVVQHRWSWRAVAPAGVLLAACTALAVFWFGSPIPASGLAKMAHEFRISGQFSLFSPALAQLTLPITALVNPPSEAARIVLAGVVVSGVVLRQNPLARTILVWVVLYGAAYHFLALPDFTWYYCPLALLSSLLLWSGFERGIAILAPRLGVTAQPTAGLATLALALGIAGTLVLAGLASRPDPSAESPAHRLAGEWLRQHAQPGDSVAAFEIGRLSYLSGLRTIDLLGLTEPAALPFLSRRDYAWAIRDLPNYVFSAESLYSWPVTDAIFRLPEFVLNYRPVARFPYRPGVDYVLYQRFTPTAASISDERWAAEWIDLYIPESIPSSARAAHSLVVRNLSNVAWLPGTADSIAVTYEWFNPDGIPIALDAGETPLPSRVEPGGSILVSAKVESPREPGEYLLQWDLIRGGQRFSSHGFVTQRARVVVR